MATHTYCCSISFLVTSDRATFEEVLKEEPEKIIAALRWKLDEINKDIDSVSIECYDAFSESEEE